MMIEFVKGNLLEAKAEALVNTVNTVGVMGKGIALQFKQAFPRNYKDYRAAAERGEVVPGNMFVHHTGTLEWPHFIINFPTKRHWRGRTRVEDIDAGLIDLVKVVNQLDISVIALPPLGCGNGGLSWDVVRPRIENALAPLTQVHVLLFGPEGRPEVDRMPVKTETPRMTTSRAIVITLLDNYLQPGYRATLLEIQKLTYFMQEAGEPLKLRFVRGPFGPYADNLNHVLQRMEGHFVRGYGDRSGGSALHLMPGSVDGARDYLWDQAETQLRLKRVHELIDGFETPHGLELLATVHWLAAHGDDEVLGLEDVIEGIRAWSARKLRIFDPFHVEVAWERLQESGWIS